MPDVADQLAKSTDRRGRRICVLWAAALTMLALLGAFCWLVVYPVCLVRAVILDPSTNRIEPNMSHDENTARIVSRLGGPERAAWRIDIYLRTPVRITEERWMAAALLGLCGRAGVAPLKRALVDADSEVRGQAAFALGRIGPDAYPAAPDLTKMLQVDDWTNQKAAAWALGEIGSTEAVFHLEKALTNEMSSVREAASKALAKIRGLPPPGEVAPPPPRPRP